MAKVKKSSVKVVKKKWIAVLSSPEFSQQKIGETFVAEDEKAVGKYCTVNLMSLTGDPKKQNLSVTFQTTHLKDGQAHSKLMKYSMSPVSVKRITRRNRSKVDDSFVLQTKDGEKVRIKPLLITKNTVSNSVATDLRRQTRAFLAANLRKSTFSQFASEVISRKLQSKLRDLLKPVYPLSVCEIRKFELVVESSEEEGAKKEAPAAQEATA